MKNQMAVKICVPGIMHLRFRARLLGHKISYKKDVLKIMKLCPVPYFLWIVN
jgi:hypothetical protein